jgi:methionyl-tRNA synthetase
MKEFMVSLGEFKKLDIRVARILEVKDHPNADKLLVLKIDTGEKQKQIVAGIKNFYKGEDLIGKQIVIIDNLEPLTLRGELSEGMLLAAQSEGIISVLTPDRPIKEGAKVK